MFRFLKDLFKKEVSNFYPIWSFSTDRENKQVISLYKRWVYTAISTIATDVAALDYALFKNDKKINHKFLDLISYDLLEAITTHLLLLWISVLWKVKAGNNILQLVVLRPDRIFKKFDEDGNLVGFEYLMNWKTYFFNKEDLIIIKNFDPENPEDELSAKSPVEAGIYSILLDDFSTKWNYQFFKQWGKIGLVLETDKTLPKDLLERLRIQFQEANKGLENAHKPIVLEGGMKIQTISTNQKDMDFVQLKEIVRDEILAYFKVPKAIVWLGEWNNLNIRNFEKIYAKRTIYPIAKKIENSFNKELFSNIWEFRFLNVVPVDVDNLKENFLAWAITLNEYRQKIGYKPLKDGDVLRIWTDLVPVDIQQESKTSSVNKKYVELGLKALKTELVGTEEWAEKKRVKFVKRADSFEEIFSQRLKRIFERQRKEVLKELNSWKNLTNYQKKDLAVYFVDKLKNGLLWLGLLKKPLKDYAKNEYVENLKDIWKNPKEFFTPEKDKELDDAIRTYILNLSDQVDKTTLEEISKIVSEGLTSWVGIDEIKNQINEKFNSYLANRVEKIVRTETTRIANQQSYQARKDTGITYKKWYTSKDERTCPYCSSLHNKIVEIDKDFASAGDVIGGKLILKNDIGYPPLHPNCRCIIVPEVN